MSQIRTKSKSEILCDFFNLLLKRAATFWPKPNPGTLLPGRFASNLKEARVRVQAREEHVHDGVVENQCTKADQA